MNSFSDRELILALQSGDTDALGVLYNRYNTLVYRTAYAITGDPDAASDLLQDAFLRLNRFSEHIDPRRPLEPWLYRMTANLSYTWLKRRKRWFHPLDDMMEWLAGVTHASHSPQQQAEKNAESQRLQQAMLTLPVQQRMVVVMYYVNDLSLQEIAEILEIPEGTVKSRLYYGRAALRQALGLNAEVSGEVTYEFT
ncbi:MAG: sigma-70 family RNA polymerase sigma factor [Anaerolineales bacterium]